MRSLRNVAALSGALGWLGLLLPILGCQEKPVAKKALAIQEVANRAPALRLLVFTNLRGALESCGCNERSLGGMDRLVSAAHRAESRGVPTLVLSAGDLFFESVGTGEAAVRARTVAEVLRLLPLAAATPGPSDLKQGVARIAELSERAGAPLLASGVLSEDSSSAKGPRSAQAFERARNTSLSAGISVVRGGLKIGIVGLVGANVESSAATVSPNAARQAGERAREFRKEGATLVVGLVSGNLNEANQLADLGELDLVVLGDGARETSELLARPVLRAGEKAERLLVVDLWIDSANAPFRRWEKPEPPPVSQHQNWVRWGSEELGKTSPQDSKAREILDRYAKDLNLANRQKFADLEPRPATPQTGGYVGSRPCASCHTAAYLWWTRSPHGNAYRSLTEVNKEYHLDCVGCHVTGYDKPGGSTVTHVEGLMNVGCESCHGPGSAHVADVRPPLRFVHKEVPEAICRSCHTREHSEAFDFETYRARLLAPGHGLPM